MDSNSIIITEGKSVDLKLDSTLTCKKEALVVENASLTLSGDGVLRSTNKKSNAAIRVTGENAVLNIDGITIDTCGEESGIGNYSYGVYLLEGSSVNFNSGRIKVGQGSCISTNNTTGGATVININGGELLSDGSYAIYSPAQEEINITGGIVQGINARIGKIHISGNAQIIPTTITEETRDDIGHNISTTGCIWFGDTIALITGTYEDASGTDTVLDIKGNATVESNFRSALAVYSVDTKIGQKVDVTISDIGKINTTDAGFNAIVVYDHEAINEAAIAAGKTYTPVATSDITITASGEVIYPVTD